ncbi:MAG TPA: metallophosphoesterase [Kofleriaceae bacterium]|nr:metallophosphoesterase [Kofleriaceae bacterium]
MRTFVMGDPQAPWAKIRELLERHGALDTTRDRLADDVVLVSIGDHFDYDHRDPVACAREGLEVLRWLASHDPAQVVLLLGNHDAARVMELATISDAEFAEAREASHRLAPHDFAARYPRLPAAGVIGRDYASFTTEQRALVMELLLAGRFHLAATGELLDGRVALLTHAGVTTRELAMLGAPADPHAIAAALEAHLAAAVERVATDWERGALAPLSLAPLHHAGPPGEEGGGLLYHRPSNPATGSTFHTERPRRFDPRTLPPITQIAGHSGHAKCVQELGVWALPGAHARKHGGIRTLRFDPQRGEVTYDLGVAPALPGAAELILIDGELRRLPPFDVELLPLGRLL